MPEPEKPKGILDAMAANLTRLYPTGTRCNYWPGRKEGKPMESVLIGPWRVVDGKVLAMVAGVKAGIRESHVEFPEVVQCN